MRTENRTPRYWSHLISLYLCHRRQSEQQRNSTGTRIFALMFPWVRCLVHFSSKKCIVHSWNRKNQGSQKQKTKERYPTSLFKMRSKQIYQATLKHFSIIPYQRDELEGKNTNINVDIIKLMTKFYVRKNINIYFLDDLELPWININSPRPK